MFSLITKIAHSTTIKDTIAVARGLYRVAASDVSPNLTNDWITQTPSKKDNLQLRKVQDQNKIDLTKQVVGLKTILLNSKSQKKDVQVNKNLQAQSKKKLDSNVVQKVQPKTGQKYQWNGALQGKERQQSKVIFSRFGRIFQYGKLGKWMLETQVEAYVARTTGHGNEQQIYQRGANKITQQLCKMRGAPLKVAQMLSIQEDNLIPAPIRKAFEKARQQAHVMPEQQVNDTLISYLGSDWKSKFKSFETKPFAAASIGQVHKATSLEGVELAVKLQYPGVQKSIESDIKNIKMLLRLPGILPKGIFLDKLLVNTQKQLRQQCNYQRQAHMHDLYNRCLQSVMGNQYSRYAIPKIYQPLSKKSLLASSFLRGVAISRFQQQKVPQDVRDQVGRLLMKLTFSQIFQMGIMQSDPNPSNFTYNIEAKQLNLFDFGATHIYDRSFLQNYCGIINASVQQNKEQIIRQSILAGFLTNQENAVMLDNHIQSILTIGDPLRWKGVYDFGNQNITEKIYKTIPQMLKNRLKPPPEQIYSLHRKLSGAYLACIRMKSRVDCSKIYSELSQNYKIQELL